MFKNDNLGLICGTFFGAILGSVGTIFTLKKLNKLEYKKDLEAEGERIAEVVEIYENRIKKLKDLKISGAAEEAKNDISKSESDKIVNENAKNAHSRITLDKSIDDPDDQKITNPKFLYQDRIAEEMKENKPNYDYSKISREQYSDLKKDYEREAIDIDEEYFPEQITMEQFEDEIAYRKENLIYYEQDGVFAGYDDIPVNDVYDEKYFGADNLSLFGSMQASLDGKSSTNELYLRDRIHNVDFHLIYNPTEAFSDIQQGGMEK